MIRVDQTSNRRRFGRADATLACPSRWPAQPAAGRTFVGSMLAMLVPLSWERRDETQRFSRTVCNGFDLDHPGNGTFLPVDELTKFGRHESLFARHAKDHPVYRKAVLGALKKKGNEFMKKIDALDVADPNYVKKYEDLVREARKDLENFQVLCRDELQKGRRLVANSAPTKTDQIEIRGDWEDLFHATGHGPDPAKGTP